MTNDKFHAGPERRITAEHFSDTGATPFRAGAGCLTGLCPAVTVSGKAARLPAFGRTKVRALVLALLMLGDGGLIMSSATAWAQPIVASGPDAGNEPDRINVERVPVHASRLHLGMSIQEVEAVMNQPATARRFGVPGSDNQELDYTAEPIRTRVTLLDGRLTGIVLRRDEIDETSLPIFARTIQFEMRRHAVLQILGAPQQDRRWISCRLPVEQMIYAPAAGPPVSVFLIAGDVVAVSSSLNPPADLVRLRLPQETPSGGAPQEQTLRIGMQFDQAKRLVGEALWSTDWSFKGQPAQAYTVRTPPGDGLLSLTFVSDTLVSLQMIPHALPMDGGDVYVPAGGDAVPGG